MKNKCFRFSRSDCILTIFFKATLEINTNWGQFLLLRSPHSYGIVCVYFIAILIAYKGENLVCKKKGKSLTKNENVSATEKRITHKPPHLIMIKKIFFRALFRCLYLLTLVLTCVVEFLAAGLPLCAGVRFCRSNSAVLLMRST